MQPANAWNSGNHATNVLIVDDDAITRTLVAEKIANLDVHTAEAEDGEKAWELLKTQSYDLAIIDLEMPNMDGFELIQIMRSNPLTSRIPVIVLTGREDRPAIEQVLLAGATSYLPKPLNWAAFGTHIADVLEASKGSVSQRPRKLAC